MACKPSSPRSKPSALKPSSPTWVSSKTVSSSAATSNRSPPSHANRLFTGALAVRCHPEAAFFAAEGSQPFHTFVAAHSAQYSPLLLEATMSEILLQLVEALHSGRLRVVDLTLPLSSATPLIPLPPQWNNSPPFALRELSRYDARG